MPPAVIAGLFRALGIDVEELVKMAKRFQEELLRHNALLQEIADNQKRMMDHAGVQFTSETAAQTGNAVAAGTGNAGAGNGAANGASEPHAG